MNSQLQVTPESWKEVEGFGIRKCSQMMSWEATAKSNCFAEMRNHQISKPDFSGGEWRRTIWACSSRSKFKLTVNFAGFQGLIFVKLRYLRYLHIHFKPWVEKIETYHFPSSISRFSHFQDDLWFFCCQRPSRTPFLPTPELATGCRTEPGRAWLRASSAAPAWSPNFKPSLHANTALIYFQC